jgi:hypothetical protein
MPAIIALTAMIALSGCSGAGPGSGSSMADLTNPFLGPEYSSWLIGPVARIASPAEVKTYLGLHDDRDAAAFIEQFWERRKPAKGTPRGGAGAAQGGSSGGTLPSIPAFTMPGRNPVLALFEERAEVADKKYSEGGVLGRRTDRGTILIVYGPPKKGGFEVAPNPSNPPIEVWEYTPDAPVGLDGKQPDRFYRFAKRGDLTVFYVPRPGSHPTLQAPPPAT